MNSSTESEIIKVIEMVCKNKGVEPPSLTSETVFDASLGLESLDFAEIIVRLEQEFGKDPFASGSVPQVSTIGDLVALYE
jgi:acyl carrier protein